MQTGPSSVSWMLPVNQSSPGGREGDQSLQLPVCRKRAICHSSTSFSIQVVAETR